MHDTSAPATPRYSPFWPLLILLAAVLIGMGWRWSELRQQMNQTRDQVQRLEPAAGQARNINNGIKIFMNDLKGLMSADAGARSIVERHVTPPAAR